MDQESLPASGKTAQPTVSLPLKSSVFVVGVIASAAKALTKADASRAAVRVRRWRGMS
jgi:hypothetical protein